MVEVVEAHEEERLTPVERAEEGVLHRAVEMARGIGGEDAREEGGAATILPLLAAWGWISNKKRQG